jgi:hypothetical protein
MIIEILLNAAAPFGRYSHLLARENDVAHRPEMAIRILLLARLHKLRVLDKKRTQPASHLGQRRSVGWVRLKSRD